MNKTCTCPKENREQDLAAVRRLHEIATGRKLEIPEKVSHEKFKRVVEEKAAKAGLKVIVKESEG